MIVELPAVYIDDVVFDDTDSAAIVLLNRFPYPNQIDVPADADFEIEIHDLDGLGTPSVPATVITIDGVIAFNAGSFLNGWSGSTASLSSPGAGVPDILRIELIPPAPFPSLDVISVRVESQVGATPIDETYSYTVEDLTPPDIVTAVATAQRTVVVTFDEPVRALGDGDLADALTVGNYAFDALNDSVTPAVTIEAVAVVALSATEFEITTDIEMTPLVEYRLTVSNVEDLFGNQI